MNNQPWEKRESESDKAYEAFYTYYNMGLERTLQKTADALGKGLQLMKNWSTLHEWQERARAWDNNNVKIWQESQELAIAEMARKQAILGAEMQDIGIQAMRKHASTIDGKVGADIMAKGVQIERTARGQATQIISTTQDVKNAGTGELIEWLKSIRAGNSNGSSEPPASD